VTSETRQGGTTAYEHDDLGRVTKVTAPSALNIADVITSYDNPSAAGLTTIATQGGSSTATTLDGFGRAIHAASAAGVQTSTGFDKEGRKAYESLPYHAGEPVRHEVFEHDVIGRLTKVTHPVVIRPDGQPETSEVRYDYDGTNMWIWDEENHMTVQERSAFGNPDETRLTVLTDADQKVWRYSYDAAGNLLRVDAPEGPDREWTFVPGTNRLATEWHPESGLTRYLRYDGAGNLEEKIDDNDRTFTYSYDGNNRLSNVEAPGSAHDLVEIRYDAFDNRTHVRNEAVETTTVYDEANRLRSRSDSIGGFTYVSRYEYDSRSNLAEIEYPNAREVVYEYDAGNRVTRITDRNDHEFAREIQYHASGAVSSLRYGNAIIETRQYDERHRTKTIQSAALGLTYSYFRQGNVQGITDGRAEYSQGFHYDLLDRLVAVTGRGAQSFTYDAQGNRRTKTTGASTVVTYGYDPATNRLTSLSGEFEHASFGYDDVGNTTSDGLQYAFTPFDMVETVTRASGSVVATYTYDADNQRVRRAVADGTHYQVRGPAGLLSEYVASGGPPTWARDYVYLGTRLIASLETPPINEGATVAFAAPLQITTSETGGFAEVTVRLALPPTLAALEAPLTVEVVPESLSTPPDEGASAGLDFTATPTTVTFAAGAQNGAVATVRVNVVDDNLYEALEYFAIRLQTVVHGRLAETETSVVAYIDDNDPQPALSISGSNTNEGGAVPFTIALSAVSGRSTRVHVQSHDDSTALADYTPINQDLVIPAGVQVVTLTTGTTRDGLIERDEELHVTLSAPVGATIGVGTAHVRIVDERNGDFNGDGLPDVLWQRLSDNQIALWVTTEANGVGSTWERIGSDVTWKIVGSADFNGDGNMDYVWRHDQDGETALWFMNFIYHDAEDYAYVQNVGGINVTGADPWRIAAVADFTRDGHPDIVWQSESDGMVAIWKMQGTTYLETLWVWNTPLDTNWKVVGSGRFDPADAKTQLLLQHATGLLSLWHLNADATWLSGDYLPEDLQVDPNYRVKATGDFNRDGVTDLVIGHETQQACVSLWLMDPAIHYASPGVPDRLGHRMTYSCIDNAPAGFDWRIVAPK
jgi:YD repeat-containing protein